MAMIKCPECGKDISSHAKMCNNCGFSLEFKTNLRFEIMLSNSEDVFNLNIVAFNNDEEIAKATINNIYSQVVEEYIYSQAMINPNTDSKLREIYKGYHNKYPYMLTAELTFYGDINKIKFIFEEHFEDKVYNINCGEYEEENIGLHFIEEQPVNDSPTFVGGGSYARILGLKPHRHPNFSYRNAEYDKIRPNCFPKVNYK